MNTAAAAPGERRTVRESIALLRSHQKPPRGVSLYTRYVNRPWGRALAAVADRLGLTPNAVTLISGAFSLTAIALIATRPPTPLMGVVIALLLTTGFALDSADGQLARLRGGGSKSGELLDHMLDALVKLLLHLAVLDAWLALGYTKPLVLLPVAFQVVAVMLFFGATLVGVLQPRTGGAAATPSTVRSILLLPVDHGVVGASFLVWGFTSVFAGVYAFLFVAHLVLLVALFVQWFRELS